MGGREGKSTAISSLLGVISRGHFRGISTGNALTSLIMSEVSVVDLYFHDCSHIVFISNIIPNDF